MKLAAAAAVNYTFFQEHHAPAKAPGRSLFFEIAVPRTTTHMFSCAPKVDTTLLGTVVGGVSQANSLSGERAQQLSERELAIPTLDGNNFDVGVLRLLLCLRCYHLKNHTWYSNNIATRIQCIIIIIVLHPRQYSASLPYTPRIPTTRSLPICADLQQNFRNGKEGHHG